MSIFQNLSAVALRQVVSGALQAVGTPASAVTDALATYLTDRFTDHSQRLTAALQRANERAWKAFEVALAGESLWDRCKGVLARAEDQAFREQVRTFLDVSPLTRASAQHAPIFRQALQELRAAKGRGLLSAGQLAPNQLARAAGAFARFNDPQALIDAEWKAVARVADELKEGCPNLYRILVARSSTGRSPSLLAVAVRYYFRREVETDQELFQGLAFAKLEMLQEVQEKGFAAISEALTRQGQRLEGLLGDVLQAMAVIGETTADTNARVRGLEEQIQKLLEQLQLQNRELRPTDSLSVRSDLEQQRVRQVVKEYRELPEAERKKRPALQNEVGKLQVAAGDFDAAQRDFKEAAANLSDPKAQAEAHHNAYRTALEREQWTEAFQALQQAVKLDSGRFALFPERYEPQCILGAGGFGVVFLCQDRYLGRAVVIKSLQTSELDRDIASVFGEARALEDLDHQGIIRLRHCDFAGAGGVRPYLVMDYFEGRNLADQVAAEGRLSPDDVLEIVRPVAEALQAAHAKGILHRDVKAGNVLVRREAGGWQVKLIDFGLALRPAALEGKGSSLASRGKTTTGRSIAGTLHYAAPEQMGQLQGVPIGRYSDVYGFGRTCYYALLGVPDPDDAEKESLPEGWRRLLSRCTGRKLENRHPDFTAVLAGLEQVQAEARKGPEPLAAPEPAPAASSAAGSDDNQASGSDGEEGDQEPASRGRREETMKVLFRRGAICAGTEIEPMPQTLPGDLAHDPKVFRVRVGNPPGRQVIWLFDNKHYSLSKLSNKLSEEHGLQWFKPHTFELWRVVGDKESLWDKALRLLQEEAEGKSVARVESVPLVKTAEGDELQNPGLPDQGGATVVGPLRFEGHRSEVNCAVFSPDGRYVVSGSSDKTVRLWETASRRELRCFKGHARKVRSVAISPDGRLILSGAYDATVRLWDTESGQQLHCFEVEAAKVRSVAFASDGRHVLAGGDDRTVHVWDVQTGKEKVSFGDGGWHARFAAGADEDFESFVATNPDATEDYGLRDAVWCIAVSPDARFVLSNGAKNTLAFWEMASGSEVRTFKGHTQMVWAIAFSTDGRLALSAGSDKTVRLWDVESGQERSRFMGHKQSIWGVAFSRDGKLAVSGGFDATVRVWEVATGREVRCLEGHAGNVLSVAFAPDGWHVLSSSRDKTIGLWELPEAKQSKM